MTSERIVAVTGATGRQGGATARHLLRAGWSVRAITRNAGSKAARRLGALGAQVVEADMDRGDELLRAFRGVHGVYSVQNPMISGIEGEIRQGMNVADAAKAAGVSHVIYGSTGSGRADTPIPSWESKMRVQSHMEGLGLPLTVLRPQAFMELMTDKDFYPPVSTWSLMPRLMGWDTPLGWLAVDDLGAIAARAFAEPETYVGADMRLMADVRSLAQCRQIWKRETGRAPRGFPMPQWLFTRFVGDDLPTMWRWLGTGRLTFDASQTLGILPEAQGVPEFVAAHR